MVNSMAFSTSLIASATIIIAFTAQALRIPIPQTNRVRLALTTLLPTALPAPVRVPQRPRRAPARTKSANPARAAKHIIWAAMVIRSFTAMVLNTFRMKIVPQPRGITATNSLNTRMPPALRAARPKILLRAMHRRASTPLRTAFMNTNSTFAKRVIAAI